MPAYSLDRACMLDSKGVGWHQSPGWFHLKCTIDCFEEKIWSLNCLCVVVCFYWLPLELYIILINIVLKGFWYPAHYSDWHPMLLFESSLSSAFWNVLSYSVIRDYSVSDFEKCTTLFHYFSLLCYLELRSTKPAASEIRHHEQTLGYQKHFKEHVADLVHGMKDLGNSFYYTQEIPWTSPRQILLQRSKHADRNSTCYSYKMDWQARWKKSLNPSRGTKCTHLMNHRRNHLHCQYSMPSPAATQFLRFPSMAKKQHGRHGRPIKVSHALSLNWAGHRSLYRMTQWTS